MFRILRFIAVGACVLLAPVYAEGLSIDFGEANGSFSGRLIQLFLLFSVLSVAPAIVIMVTSFTRIVVVFSFLRSAMGLQQSPPNMILTSLALFLTLFIMAPVFEESYNQGVAPLVAEQIQESEALGKITAPFQTFMLNNVREKDLRLFLDFAKIDYVDAPEATPLRVLVPAFMISELRRAFEIGFLVFLPFLVIDLVVASVLMSLGMMMLPPVMISLPFKIIFFVLIDGWFLICGSLVNSFIT